MDNNDIINMNFLHKVLKKDDIIVDIGANYGDYTGFFLSELKNGGKVYAIELHPDTFKHLSDKFRLVENIVLLNNAVSNINEPIPFYAGRDAWTNNIIGHDMNFNPNKKIGEIQGIRLDTLLKDEKEIGLIKIDVEGAEYLVLEGMENIINNVRNILVECHLDEDWIKIRTLLLDKYKLDCINLITKEEITNNSNRAYQCFCKQKVK